MIKKRMENPTYYAIIPAEVRYDKRLNPSAKLLYGEITCLTNKTGECWATDNYFASLYNVSKSTIQRWLSDLKECGYIKSTIIYKENSKIIDKRIIILAHTYTQDCTYPIVKNDNRPICIDDNRPICKNDIDNNININNINMNTIKYNTQVSNSSESIKEIVDYLNNKTNKHYRVTDKTKSLINSKLKQEYTVDDFKKVIDNKVLDWTGVITKDGNNMENYLRPDTLFGNKFDQYLNESVNTAKIAEKQKIQKMVNQKYEKPISNEEF